jgi:hypothetical protein
LQKKKQKNSRLLRVLAPALPTPPASKSFLLLFFKKEVLSYLLQPALTKHYFVSLPR